MADLTFADYISEVYGYMNENRDTPANNRKIRLDDVKKAINRGRHRMLRKVGLGVYRGSAVTNATTGAITPPADFFNQGMLSFTAVGINPVNLTVTDAKMMDQTKPGWRTAQSGTPSQAVYDITDAGLVVVLSPPPASTVTNGLTWRYSAKLADLVADVDKCPIMNLFPEFQMTTLQAGALRLLYLLEAGEGDDQFAKWDMIFEKDIDELRGSVNSLFASRTTQAGFR